MGEMEKYQDCLINVQCVSFFPYLNGVGIKKQTQLKLLHLIWLLRTSTQTIIKELINWIKNLATYFPPK